MDWIRANEDILDPQEALVRFTAGMEHAGRGLPNGVLRALSFYVESPGRSFFKTLKRIARDTGFSAHLGDYFQKRLGSKTKTYRVVWVLNERP